MRRHAWAAVAALLAALLTPAVDAQVREVGHHAAHCAAAPFRPALLTRAIAVSPATACPRRHRLDRERLQSTFVVYVGSESLAADSSSFPLTTANGGLLSTAAAPAWALLNFYPATLIIAQGDRVDFAFQTERPYAVVWSAVPRTLRNASLSLGATSAPTASALANAFVGTSTISSGWMTTGRSDGRTRGYMVVERGAGAHSRCVCLMSCLPSPDPLILS